MTGHHANRANYNTEVQTSESCNHIHTIQNGVFTNVLSTHGTLVGAGELMSHNHAGNNLKRVSIVPLSRLLRLAAVG